METSILQTCLDARNDFPMLNADAAHPLVYLDSAATKLKPQMVIDRMTRFYQTEYATVHRGVYSLSMNATDMYDATRKKCARFLNAGSAREIVFVRGATEAINLVAHSYGKPFITAGKEILITEIEHHANIVPWQQLCRENGCTLVVAPVDDLGNLNMAEFEKLLSANTALVSVFHIANTIGTVNPIADIIQKAHAVGAKVLIDAAQSIAHCPLDVRALDCDFLVMSGHKFYAPTGIGFLYAKYALLEQMEPYQTGGAMIDLVRFDRTTFVAPPERFEAGTPAFVEVIGLGAAIDYLESIGLSTILAYEESLLHYALEQMKAFPGITLIGQPETQASVISFAMDGIHPHDIGTILDERNICIRVGHHCSQPTMRRFQVAATARLSLALYNTRADIDKFIVGLEQVKEIML